MLQPTEEACRALRRQVTGTEYTRVLIGDQPVLARRHTDHNSAPVYIVRLVRPDFAEHAMITKQCKFKRNGTATPNPIELAAWEKLV